MTPQISPQSASKPLRDKIPAPAPRTPSARRNPLETPIQRQCRKELEHARARERTAKDSLDAIDQRIRKAASDPERHALASERQAVRSRFDDATRLRIAKENALLAARTEP